MKSLILAALLTFSVTGCNTSKPIIKQQNLLVKCQELPNLTGKTGKDVFNIMTIWGSMYAECKERHSSLVDAIENKK